jgi:hypothetical protein
LLRTCNNPASPPGSAIRSTAPTPSEAPMTSAPSRQVVSPSIAMIKPQTTPITTISNGQTRSDRPAVGSC